MELKFKNRTSSTIDTLIDNGMILVGSPETVRQRIEHCQKEMGFGHLMAMLQIATMPADMTERNIRLFASEVMPHLQGAVKPQLRAIA